MSGRGWIVGGAVWLILAWVLDLSAAASTTAGALAFPPEPTPEYRAYLPYIARNTGWPSVHAVRISYPDVAQSRPLVPELQAQVAQAGVNLVGLGAGRPDWTYFRWAGHEGWWSSDVRDTGLDFLAEDAENFAFVGQVDAVVDVYAPNYIAGHPEAAAISYWGEPSPLQVSTAALVQGPFHDLLLDMIEYIAANYAVDSISLTELSYHIYGYGPEDLALYRAYTGREDWPRYSNLAARYAPARFIISVGMWDGSGGAISPADLETAITSAPTGGIPHLWVTPSHLMGADHWAVLTGAWNP